MTDCPERPAITPEMKLDTLLEAYPNVENTLLDLAPAIAKLQNPVLRKTIAGVTDIRAAADAGNISLGEMIGKLRNAAGIEQEWSESPTGRARPEWLDEVNVVVKLDARPMIQAGEHPLPQVMSGIQQLDPGEIFLLVAPFTPTPLIEKVRSAGNLAWSEQVGPTEYNTYFARGE